MPSDISPDLHPPIQSKAIKLPNFRLRIASAKNALPPTWGGVEGCMISGRGALAGDELREGRVRVAPQARQARRHGALEVPPQQLAVAQPWQRATGTGVLLGETNGFPW